MALQHGTTVMQVNGTNAINVLHMEFITMNILKQYFKNLHIHFKCVHLNIKTVSIFLFQYARQQNILCVFGSVKDIHLKLFFRLSSQELVLYIFFLHSTATSYPVSS
jgi:hypothetical protein